MSVEDIKVVQFRKTHVLKAFHEMTGTAPAVRILRKTPVFITLKGI